MVPDEKVPFAAVFTIAREDHTVGNLLRMELLRDPRVKFAGYKHPHPLDNDIILRVQSGITVSPAAVVVDAARRLEDELRVLQSAFEAQVGPGGRGVGGWAGGGEWGGMRHRVTVAHRHRHRGVCGAAAAPVEGDPVGGAVSPSHALSTRPRPTPCRLCRVGAQVKAKAEEGAI
jgi:DNA-directed RNA polymerase II subunit RPB11